MKIKLQKQYMKDELKGLEEREDWGSWEIDLVRLWKRCENSEEQKALQCTVGEEA